MGDTSISIATHQTKVHHDCVRMQLDEFTMLASIFCGTDEFMVEDPSIEADLNAFLDNAMTATGLLQYTVRMQLKQPYGRLDIRIELPHLYPLIEQAHVSVLAAAIRPDASDALRHDLDEYIGTLDRTEVYVYQVCQWVQDNAVSYINRKMPMEVSGKSMLPSVERVEMERLWIYSHHLYCRTKRQELVRLAKVLDLSGFTRPGRPGIICVEGRKEDVQEYWRTMRQWCWKRIQMRKSETKIVTADGGVAAFRRFPLPLQEKMFASSSGNVIGGGGVGDEEEDVEAVDGAGEEMSMAAFMQFLDANRCAYIKKDLFGFA